MARKTLEMPALTRHLASACRAAAAERDITTIAADLKCFVRETVRSMPAVTPIPPAPAEDADEPDVEWLDADAFSAPLAETS